MDSKLQEILLDYGLEGYGLYWYCLEMIVNKIDADNLTFELEHDSRIIARNTGSTPKKISEMMLRFVELGLFQNSEGRVTCLKLLQRLDKSMTSNVKFRSMLDQAKQSHDSVMMKPDLVMQDNITLEEITQDKITLKESNKSSNEDAIQSVIDLYNQAIKDNKPNWPRCTTTNDKRKKLVKEALKLVKPRAIETNQSPIEYLGSLFDAMASDEYYSGYKKSAKYPNGYERPFDLNFRQDELMRAMDKFITMSEQA